MEFFLKKLILLLVIITIATSSCTPEEELYSFFVAGHVYGKPDPKSIGAYPLFKDKFDLIKSNPKMSFGILTGDMVFVSTDERWDSLENDLKLLNLPIHHAVGNHEVIHKRPHYEERNGKTYSSFTQNEDLFILLDPLLDEWNISGKQLEFLKSTLEQNKKLDGNIFVFFHQLLWWSPDNKFKNVKPNWIGYRSDTCNFEKEIIPLFENTKRPVFMFAGDIGAYSNKNSFFYHKEKNITLVASGMGGGTHDNFLIIKVKERNNIEIDLINLNGKDIHALGEIQDYVLP